MEPGSGVSVGVGRTATLPWFLISALSLFQNIVFYYRFRYSKWNQAVVCLLVLDVLQLCHDFLYLGSFTVLEHCVLLLFQVQQVEPGSGVSVGVGRTAGISSLQSMWRGDDVSTTTDATQ